MTHPHHFTHAGAMPLAQRIEEALRALPEREVSLREIVDDFGGDSLMLLTIFLSLIFLVPVSIPGVSTVFGTGIVLIGITRLLDRQLWMPQRVARRALSAARLREGLQTALVWLRRLERVSRAQRMRQLTAEGAMTLCNNSALVLAGLLLMMPFGLVPFSNTLPAVAVILLSIGMMQQDGGAVLLGYFTLLVTVLYFAVLLVAGGAAVMELLRWLG